MAGPASGLSEALPAELWGASGLWRACRVRDSADLVSTAQRGLEGSALSPPKWEYYQVRFSNRVFHLILTSK